MHTTNFGLGPVHRRAYKRLDYDPFGNSRYKAVPAPSDIPYEDYDALSNALDQLPYYGDPDADENNPISVFIGAELAPAVGLWVDLPTDEEVINEVISYVSFNGRSDWDVMDIAAINSVLYEWARNESLTTLNNVAEELTGMSTYEMQAFTIVLGEWGITNDPVEAAEIVDEVSYYESRRDAAYELLEYASPDILARYFDWDSFRNDLEYDWGLDDEQQEVYGSFDDYVDDMYDLMSSEDNPDFWRKYVDQDAYMNDVEIEASTHEDSTGYYIYYG